MTYGKYETVMGRKIGENFLSYVRGGHAVVTDHEPVAAILCRSMIMKDAIKASLKSFGIDCTDEPRNADIAIVVSGMLHASDEPKAGSACALDHTDAHRWVVLSNSDDDPVCRKLMDKGEQPCRVPEDIDGNDLGHVVKLAASGNVLMMGRFCNKDHPKDVRILEKARLDDRQWQLMIHLADGLSNKEIANVENTTESAVKARIRGLLQKLQLNNRTKAAVLAAKCGLGTRTPS